MQNRLEQAQTTEQTMSTLDNAESFAKKLPTIEVESHKEERLEYEANPLEQQAMPKHKAVNNVQAVDDTAII